VARWVSDECIDAAELDRRPVAEVYKQYQDWADDAGEKFTRNRSEFSKALVDYFGLTRVDAGTLIADRIKLNGRVVRAYRLVNSSEIEQKG